MCVWGGCDCECEDWLNTLKPVTSSYSSSSSFQGKKFHGWTSFGSYSAFRSLFRRPADLDGRYFLPKQIALVSVSLKSLLLCLPGL